jgi:transporter family-2 protein
MLAGMSVAVQASLTAAAQRTLGPIVVVAISGLTTGLLALLISLAMTRPEFTGRAVGYTVASGILGGIILGSIAFAAGQNGVARTLSVVIATQLLVSLLLDAFGFFGAGADLSALKVLGVAMILVGGILVVRY